jgi:O-antigen ligase
MFTILLILIFIRPFISSPAYPGLNTIYSLVLLLYLLVWFLSKRTLLTIENKIKPPLVLFCILLTVSAFFAVDKIKAAIELSDLITGIFIFLAVYSLDERKKARVIRLIVFTGFSISLMAIYQYFFGFRHIEEFIKQENLSLPFAQDYIQSRRVFYPFFTPNTLAGYLAMLIPLALIDKQRKWMILVLSLTFLLTQSLGAFLSILAGALFYFFITGKIDKRKILFLTAMLAIISMVFVLRESKPQKDLQPAFSAMMRINYWIDTLKIIRTHPLIGTGLGNFNLEQSRNSHNSYLQICAQTGLIGLFFLSWLVGIVITAALRKIKEKSLPRESIFLFISVTVFLLHNLVDITFFLPEVSLTWWIILGCLI